jgi:hypothetical protein
VALGVVKEKKDRTQQSSSLQLFCSLQVTRLLQLEVRQDLPFGISLYESIRSLINELMKDAFQK